MHEGHRKRMKEKYLKSGLSGFEEHEALELLLFFSLKRVNTNPIAHRLIKKFGSFAQVLDADESELMEVEGVGKETALFLKSIPEFSNFYHRNRWKNLSTLTNKTETGIFCSDLIGELLYEVFYVICLDSGRRILSTIKLSEGVVDRVNVDKRKLLTEVLKYPTKAVVLAHNHPGGAKQASDSDRALTYELCQLLESVGIEVLDHIIVCGRNFLSMEECGMMK